jgi:hypothetical protein
METLVTYLVAAMQAWVPLGIQAPEPREEALARYASIATDAAKVAMDPAEAPLFAGADGRARTALLMLSVASFESDFHKSVDEGRRRGDNGRSYCVMQIHVGDETTRDGWTGPQMIQDRTLCFRAGLHLLRWSLGVCQSLELDDRLSAYVAGRCFVSVRFSRARIGRARAWWESHAM